MRNEGYRLLQFAIVGLFSFAFFGCVQTRYRYGVGDTASYERLVSPIASNPVSIGGQHPHIDRIESIVQAPHKFIEKHFSFIGRRFRSKKKELEKSPDQLQQEAIDLSQEYLALNRLDDIYVDIRRYEPSEQWSRLRANNRIAPFWKYTGGTMSVVAYSLFPGRAFHSDNYNPYTNTLNINGYRPTHTLYQTAIAKEYHQHEWLGTYAISQNLPVFPLLHNARVTADVITYTHVHEKWDLEKELYPSSYAQLTNSAVTQVLFVVPIAPGSPSYVAPVAKIALGGVGMLTGRTVAKREEKKRVDNMQESRDKVQE